MRYTLLPALLAIGTLICSALPAFADPSGARDRLARGVNISKWYWLAHGRDPDTFITPADAAQLAELGFTHVRVPVDPVWLWDHEQESIRAANLDKLRGGVDRLTTAGLAVILEVHPLGSTWPGANTPEGAERLKALWKQLAPALADTDSGAILLEPLNEPANFRSPALWAELQRELHAIVRDACPRHTIILTGDRYSAVEGLLALDPLDDPNVVYTFHIYDPHSFTHQGADWGPEHWKHMRDVPFPGTGEAMQQAIAAADDRAKGALRWYAQEEWTEDRVRALILQAVDWGRKHNVQVYCGEFGVHRPVSPLEDRRRWLSLVRETLEEHDVGWAVWEYVGTFGVMEGRAGSRQPVGDVWDVLMSVGQPQPE